MSTAKKCVITPFSGFTLVECMLYVTLVSIVAIVSGVWIARISSIKESNSQELMIHLAHDQLCADLLRAGIHADGWKLSDSEWTFGSADLATPVVSWHLKPNKRLVRVVKSYDPNTKRWKSGKSSLIARQIERMRVTHNTQDMCCRVELAGGSGRLCSVCTTLPLRAGRRVGR